MTARIRYIRPHSLREALGFLAEHGKQTSVLAGGTDLTIALRKGELLSLYLLDVSRLEALRSIRREDNLLRLGAAVTFTEIVDSALVRASAPVLAAATRCVGSLQVRNMGTLGGNVANASPAADGIPPLVVHNARAMVQSASSERVVPVDELVKGPYLTGLTPGELITEFLVEPVSAHYRHCFHRVARRRALAVARMNVAVIGSVDTGGRIDDVRISVGSVTPAPCRTSAAEALLVGNVPDLEAIEGAARAVSQEMIRRSGTRASTEYKKPAVEGLVIKALSELFGLEQPLIPTPMAQNATT